MANANLRFFTTAGATLSGLSFGTVIAGQESYTTELVLWNNKDGASEADDAVDVIVAARNATDPVDDDPIAQGWLYARSSDIENPDDADNFFDDSQALYTRLSDTQNLEIGDIPNNCGRHILFKVMPPPSATPQAGLEFRLIAGSGPIFDPLPIYFNRAFGDGVVDEVRPQIFPALLYRKNGVWSDMSLRVGGAYTDLNSRSYRIEIVVGGIVGVATYRASDDAGSSWGSTLTSSTTSFTQVRDSDDESQGVTLKWSSVSGQTLAAGDAWNIAVSTSPFTFLAGLSNALTGYIGFGDALLYNNRVRPRSVTEITGLTPSTLSFAFLDAGGDFVFYDDPTPRVGQLCLGWFETDADNVTDVGELAPKVTLGLDLLDDFAPVFGSNVGLTWTLYKGRYRKFNEVLTIPSDGSFTTEISLTASTLNYLQIDPLNNVILRSSAYQQDHPPLFRVLTNASFVIEWHDDRTRIGVSNLEVNVGTTIASLATGTTRAFTISGAGIRTHIRDLTVTPTPTGSGYTISFYRNSVLSTLEYQAGTISGTYADHFHWFHENNDGVDSIYGILENRTGAATTFAIALVGERVA